MFVTPTQHLPRIRNETVGLPLRPLDVVKRVALACFGDLAVSVAMVSAVALFVPSAAGIVLLINAVIVQCAVSLFFHSVGAFAAYQASQNGRYRLTFERILTVCEWVTGTNFALLTGFNTQFLIHETGHALASFAVYKNPQPEIEIVPFMGGLTTYHKGLSNFGKQVGAPASSSFVIASGPALTLLVSSALLAIGMAILEKYPAVGKYFISWGILDFLNHAQYAYSALHTDVSNLAHDFVHLSLFGLNPAVATIVFLAIPVVILTGVYWARNNPRQPQLFPPVEVFV